MRDEPKLPDQMPEPGFYYHYKRADHAYEMMGVSWHTETGEYAVLYRPLYEDAFTYKHGLQGFSRPLDMFMEAVMHDGREMPRFVRITDTERIKELIRIRSEMYEERSL